MLLLVSSVLGATIPSRYTLDFYKQNGIQNLTTLETTNATIRQLSLGNGTTTGNMSVDSSNNLLFQFTGSGTLKVNGQSVCLANGTYCPSSSGTSDGTGGWTNTTTQTTTSLNVGIGTGAPLSQFDVFLSSTAESFRLLNNVTSAFAGSFKLAKVGNSTTAGGTAFGGDEIANIEAQTWNGTTFRRSALMQFQASNSHSSTNQGTSIAFYQFPRNDLNLRLTMYLAGSNVYIGNNTAVTYPSDKLTVDGYLNVTQLMKFNNFAYPSCSGALAGAIAYNNTAFKHVGCNGTAWNNLY